MKRGQLKMPGEAAYRQGEDGVEPMEEEEVPMGGESGEQDPVLGGEEAGGGEPVVEEEVVSENEMAELQGLNR